MHMNKNLVDHLTVLVGTGVGRLLLFAATIMIARMLGAHDFGVFTLFYLTLTISSIIPNSIDTTYIKFARSKPIMEKSAYFNACSAVKLLYVLGVLCAGAVAIVGFGSKSDTLNYIAYGAMAGVFLCFSQSLATRYQENERFVCYSLMELIFSVAVFVCVAGLYVMSLEVSIQQVLQLYAAISISIGIAFLGYLQATTKFLGAFDFLKVRKILGLGKWIIGITACVFLFSRVDVFLLSSLVDFRDVGMYGVASQLMMAVGLVVRSMSKVLLPKAMSALRSKDSLHAYLRSTSGSIVIVMAFIAILIVFAKYIILYTYGAKFLNAVLPFRILLLGTIFTTLNVPFSFLYYTIDAPATRFWIELVKFGAGAVLILSLIYHGGIIGAAIGMAAVNIVYSILSVAMIYVKIQRHFITQET